MENIIQINGNVKFSITLDPGVWIFDDRKLDLNTYFDVPIEERPDELTAYKKAISKQWEKEITEGAMKPPTLASEQKYEKEKILTGSFGMLLKPFLKNAEPKETANTFIIEMKDGEVELSLTEAYNLILGFSKDGKPLKEDGPVYIYYHDGSNKENPLKNVTGFRVE